MTRARIAALAVLAGVLCACPPSVVPRMLGWRTAAPALPTEGRVAVNIVKNRRPQDRGGGDASLVGYQRGEVEERTSLRTTDDPTGPLLHSVRQLVTEALRSAAFDVTDVADRYTTALIDVDVLELWCDGAVVPRGRVALTLHVLDPVTHAERAQIAVTGAGDIDPASLTGSPECQRDPTSAPCAYFALPMNDVYRNIVSAFQRPENRAAATANGAQPGE